MKWTIPLLILVMAWSGCSRKSAEGDTVRDIKMDKAILETTQYLGYEPLTDPIPAPSFDVEESSHTITKYWSEMSTEEVNRNLPNTDSFVLVQKNEKSGRISFLPVNFSGEKGSYTVYTDYMKYRAEPIYHSEDNSFQGIAKVGVGLRIVANVTTSKKKLDLANLSSILLSVKKGELKGSLHTEVIGVESEDITNLMPATSEINDTSIQLAMQGLYAIKSKIHDPDVSLTPHIVAFKRANAEVSRDSLLARIKALH